METTMERPVVDHERFRRFVRQYDERLRRLAGGLLGGDPHRVDDALQEAYLRAYRHLESFRAEAEVGTWLYRVVTNVCLDELRQGGRRPAPVDMTAATWDRPSGAAGPERTVTAADTVRRALDALPGDQRAAVLLVDGEGFGFDAAAEVLGIPAGTVASRVSRGRTAIRRALGEQTEVDR
jgi:RNA polymerase sigma-70 factor (ECF subfamily)